jgi:CRP-like cAMP-binding protein
MENQYNMKPLHYKKDAYIIVEGKQKADFFFIIQVGNVKIFKETMVRGEDDVLGPGDIFGVISTMSSHSQIETAQALTDVALIPVHQHQYAEFIGKNTEVAIKIITHFSKHLRYLNEALVKLTLKKTAINSLSHLYNVGEYYFNQNQYNQALHAYTQYLKHCPEGGKTNAARDRLEKLAGHAVITEFNTNDLNRTYRKNTMLFAEGEPGGELFIIQKGSVGITKIVDNKEMLLAMLNPGDILGEMALLEGKLRTANAVAYDDCEVLAVNKANFELLIKTQPQLIARITSVLADRLWLMDEQLGNAQIDNPIGRMYDALFIQLEKSRVRLDGAAPYTFAFGWSELYKMVGLPEHEGDMLLSEMMKNKKIMIIDGKIHTTSVEEIYKQSEYFRKMNREKAKKRINSINHYA